MSRVSADRCKLSLAVAGVAGPQADRRTSTSPRGILASSRSARRVIAMLGARGSYVVAAAGEKNEVRESAGLRSAARGIGDSERGTPTETMHEDKESRGLA